MVRSARQILFFMIRAVRALIAFATLGMSACSNRSVPEEQIVNAVRTYYSNPVEYGGPQIFGFNQHAVRYEVKNSYLRTIEDERWHFYDIAVETKGSGGDMIQLLPFKFVKRGNSWYWAINRESKVEQLAKDSLTDGAITLEVTPPVTSAKSDRRTTPPVTESNAQTPHLENRQQENTPASPEFRIPQQQIDEAARIGAEEWMKKHPNQVMDDKTRAEIQRQAQQQYQKDAESKPSPKGNVPLGFNSQDLKEFVNAFYAWWMRGVTRQSLLPVSNYFNPKVLEKLIANMEQRPDADPFTGEADDHFNPEHTIGPPDKTADSVILEVRFRDGYTRKIILGSFSAHWRINDVLDDDGESTLFGPRK